MLGYVLLFKIFRSEKKITYHHDFILIPLTLSVLLLFLVPDGSSAGMMSFRFLNFIFIFLIMWLAIQKYNSIFILSIISIFCIFHVKLIKKRHDLFIKPLSEHASEMYEASLVIPENCIVLPINLSNNWLEKHIDGLLGSERKIVILNNYESYLGWFPVLKKDQEFNYYTLSNDDYLDLIVHSKQPFTRVNQNVQAVCVYGETANIQSAEYNLISQGLASHYRLAYSSAGNFVHIYLHK